MPPLFMRSNRGTLLHQSADAAVDLQIDYARRHDVPWGISESGYYRFDAAQNYQYRAFGVPGLGFKRGLDNDLVIAPYASLIAVPWRPRAVVENLRRLRDLEMEGIYGHYEAIDFTQRRLPVGQRHARVLSYMAHHHGMSLMALVNYLKDEPMVRRFHSHPAIQTVEMLLNEQIPLAVPTQTPATEEMPALRPAQPQVSLAPWTVPVETPSPQVHYLANGSYGVLITNAGSGRSDFNDIALTRWRADVTLDDWGQWIYLRDRASSDVWTVTPQPMPDDAKQCEVLFHPHMAEFRCQQNQVAANLKVFVSLDDDVEIRELTLTNQSDRPRHLDVTSYAEVALAAQNADVRHPAFNKLFIQSDYHPEIEGLIFWRRLRSTHETPLAMAHAFLGGDQATGADELTYESDRRRFLGRHGSITAPAALRPDAALSNTVGATLDPVMSLRREVRLDPHQSVRLAFLTAAGHSRRQVVDTVQRYRSWSTIQHTQEQVRARLEHEMRQQGITIDELRQNQQLLSLLLYPTTALRADPSVLARNRRGQASLWPHAISGDYPILLLRIHEPEQLALVRRVLRAHGLWRRQGLHIDLAILNQFDVGYGQELHEQIMRLLVRRGSEGWLNQRGGIFVVRAEQLSEEERVLLETAARVILDGEGGTLAEQLAPAKEQPTPLPPLQPTRRVEEEAEDGEAAPPGGPADDRQFDNGYGGFSADGRQYVIDWRPGQNTPAPWSNVVANPDFGFLITEAGSGTTWAENSGENRLTPWSNDPMQDPAGEALYLRDEETGAIWTPTPLPAGANARYRIRHGSGYTIFEHRSHQLDQELRLFTTAADPVKIARLRLTNRSDRPRRLTATYYAEWVLGPSRETMQPYVVPEFNSDPQALLARNAYNAEFGERVAFVAASQDAHGVTVDRTEFLGRLGRRRRPAALARIGLSGHVEAGVDPCAAYQIHLDLPPGASTVVHFLIGEGRDRAHALELVGRYRSAAAVDEAWHHWTGFWDRVLGAVQVETPDPAMDLILNRWLLYQALACRIWGRTAFYQSSGAFGFRDQLQDVLATLHALPDEAFRQIVRAARHQFVEGDVLHWWHPPSGRGVRTRITDDLLWLPYVVAAYVMQTGDESVLWAEEPFLRGAPLRPDEEERYGFYEQTDERFSIYEHCRRAMEKGWERRSARGLPLIGGGDWNDGMNRVGIEGKGESIWLGWFFHRTLCDFAQLAERVGQEDDARLYRQRAGDLRTALERHAWDGDWYLRATYDDGTPLGSHRNRECRIDAIAQSWSVLSGAGDAARARQAMEAVRRRLIRSDERLLLLFTPPFDQTPKDPGYIKGYLPGIRENGGQYTHAATWTVWAFAQLGQGTRAEELFGFLNPINRSRTPQEAQHYVVEPYVVAADIYSVPPHVGHGGWTWYTGSSGWLYRLGIEAILGLRRVGDRLRVEPCIPAHWPGYRLTYRHGDAIYRIHVDNSAGVQQGVGKVTVDGVETDGTIQLRDDGGTHEVVVELNKENSPDRSIS